MARKMPRYKQATDGVRGSREAWSQAANAMRLRMQNSTAIHLQALGLATLPASLADLTKIWKRAMVKAHPDKEGGSVEEAQKLNAAYAALSQAYSAPPTVVAPASSAELKVLHPPRCEWELPDNLEDPNLIADLKIDGDRIVMYLNLNPYTGASQTTMLTRHIGKHSKQYGNRAPAHPTIACDYPGLDGTVLDCELYQGMLYAFDIPFYRGRDLRALPLRERRAHLKEALVEMNNPQVILIPSWTGDLMAKFQEIVAQGGEGLVVKDLNAAYGVNWAKLKKSFDVSCVVLYLNETDKGQGSFTFGVYDDGKMVEIGRCNGGNESFVGKVVDLFIQELTVHGKSRHASFHRFRDDLNPEDCTLKKLKDDLKKAAIASRVKERAQ